MDPRDTTSSAIELLYKVSHQGKAVDIFEHLPRLRALAREVNHVTEFGVRHGFGSTAAFLAAKPDKLVSYDLSPCTNYDLFSLAAETPWVFLIGNSLDIEIEETDLLFIDTYHSYTQLQQELRLHHENVRKYIALHDTVSFGHRGEDGCIPGLLQAALDFVEEFKTVWRVKEHHLNNNGLFIMERI